MMKYLRTIIFAIILGAVIDLSWVVFAQDAVNSSTALRTPVNYSSAQLRDPFVSVIKKEAKPEKSNLENTELPKIDPDKFKVEGLIWGSKFTQAIINGVVLREGDLIDGAEVIKIEKDGVTLDYSGQVIDLPAPGRSKILEHLT